MKDVEHMGDGVFIKADFITPGCTSFNEHYVNNIEEIPGVQFIINKILSNYELKIGPILGNEERDLSNIGIIPDFLNSEEKDLILRSINETIFNKLQLMHSRQNSLMEIK
jgi:hypothetical protein